MPRNLDLLRVIGIPVPVVLAPAYMFDQYDWPRAAVAMDSLVVVDSCKLDLNRSVLELVPGIGSGIWVDSVFGPDLFFWEGGMTFHPLWQNSQLQ